MAKAADIPSTLQADAESVDGARSRAVSGNRKRTGPWEWLSRRQALRQARERVQEARPRFPELIRRARAAAELGDRVFDTRESLSLGTCKHLAADLYRQSTYWSLSALGDGSVELKPLEQLWQSSKSVEGLVLPADAIPREKLDALMRNGDFRVLAELPDPESHAAAENLRALAHSALHLLDREDSAVRKLLFQRFIRLTAATVIVALIGTAAAVSIQYLTRKPNLALGKPWRASSEWAKCQPEIRTCGALRSNIFFHTKEDASPWVEFDLGVPMSFSEVYVKNRSDGVPDRAVPLVIEASDDAKHWRQVARRENTFRSWTASFDPVTARYVRLRVDRRSYFHLDIVEIRP